MTLPLAVCVLILRRNGHVLAVSRRKDPTNWGLPGGKVDPGETLLQAAVRETKEEVGMTLDPSKLKPIFTEVCPGDVTYEVTTFFYDEPGPDLEDLLAEADLGMKYHDFDVLTNKGSSPFADYNRGVLRSFAGLLVSQMRKTNPLSL